MVIYLIVVTAPHTNQYIIYDFFHNRNIVKKIGYNVLVCMGEVLKNHISFGKIIISLKYFVFMVVDQQLCDRQNLVQIGQGISEEM